MKKYIYTGTEEQLIEEGFETYWEEINARIRDCKYTIDGQMYEDILVIHLGDGEINVDIPKGNNEETIKEVAKDLLAKGLVKVVG